MTKKKLGSAQQQTCLLAEKKSLLIKRENQGGNPDLPQLAAVEKLPFKMSDKTGKSTE